VGGSALSSFPKRHKGGKVKRPILVVLYVVLLFAAMLVFAQFFSCPTRAATFN